MALETGSYDARLVDVVSSMRRRFDSLKTCLTLIGQLPAGQNVVVSPHSLASLLAVLYCGTKGQTRGELERILCLSDDAVEDSAVATSQLRKFAETDRCRVSSSNAAYVAAGVAVEREYAKHLERLAAKIASVDFANEPEVAREKINAWVADETGGLIKNLLPHDAVDRNTALVLANAIYFKGVWLEPFDFEKTHDGEFHVASGKVVVAKMMSVSSRFRYCLDEQLRAHLLLLPYAGSGVGDDRGDEVGMLIVLPLEGVSVGDCLQLVQSGNDTLAAIVARMLVTDVDVVLPRFSVTSFVNVRDCLKVLGVRSLFSGDADLSGMCSDRRLVVSSCIHKASVDVSEEGTEASAASLSAIMSRCMVWPEKFTCNRPFGFVIWHKASASSLFFGRIDDPTLVAQN